MLNLLPLVLGVGHRPVERVHLLELDVILENKDQFPDCIKDRFSFPNISFHFRSKELRAGDRQDLTVDISLSFHLSLLRSQIKHSIHLAT